MIVRDFDSPFFFSYLFLPAKTTRVVRTLGPIPPGRGSGDERSSARPLGYSGRAPAGQIGVLRTGLQDGRPSVGDGLAVAVIQIVHDGGKCALGIPGEPGHR